MADDAAHPKDIDSAALRPSLADSPSKPFGVADIRWEIPPLYKNDSAKPLIRPVDSTSKKVESTSATRLIQWNPPAKQIGSFK